MFSDILDSGTFPTHWNIGVIKPIYKRKGDKRSPANYRGITLTSCSGNLFTSILQSRLNKFIEQHNILNPEQFGFRPISRTTDSLFILQQLLNKSTKQHKKNFMLASSIMKKRLIDSPSMELYPYGVKGKFF